MKTNDIYCKQAPSGTPYKTNFRLNNEQTLAKTNWITVSAFIEKFRKSKHNKTLLYETYLKLGEL
jgi:hypothetical protein